MDDYLGKSYQKDGTPFWTKKELMKWYRKECPKGHHLWDEVLGIEKHYLFCDACGKMEYDLTIEVKKEDPL
jgi:hypothetical protein